MPGVPSGRGCEACKKQKKKCDQSKPVCSRCMRLRIACIGCGQQRYKFKDQTMALQSAKKVHRGQKLDFVLPELSKSPSNETSLAISYLVSALEVKDARYDITCYGDFLKHIPKRLGTNSALDTSVIALSKSFATLNTGQSCRESVATYMCALKTLRTCLNDPVQAQTTETMCAIYLVMVCQGWIGQPDDQRLSHGEVIAYVLSKASPQDWQGNFEVELLIPLCMTVIVESFVNPRVQLNPWLQKLMSNFSDYGPPKPAIGGESIPSLQLSNLAKVSGYVRDPELHLFEIPGEYQRMLTDVPKLRRYVAKLADLVHSSDPVPLHVASLIPRYQTAFGLLLTLAITLNAMLRAPDPYNMQLNQECDEFVDEVVALAEDASRYRPLGASYMPICLIAAWAATNDPRKRLEVEKILSEYQKDFVSARWMDTAIWLKNKFDGLCMDNTENNCARGPAFPSNFGKNAREVTTCSVM